MVAMKLRRPMRFHLASWLSCGWLLCGTVACIWTLPSACHADATSDQLEVLRSMQPGDEAAMKQAASIAKSLRSNPDVTLVRVLSAMKGASPIGKNWLVGLANAMHSRPSVPTAQLESFLADTNQDSEARYTVFRWLTDGNAELKAQWLDRMLDDPSLEIRFDAVARALAASDDLSKEALQKLLDAARHPDQIVAIVGRLDKLGVKIDQAKHFGFLTEWKLIGPFDNVGTKHFSTVYPVETDALANRVADGYEGKNGKVQWQSAKTDSPEGVLDVAKIYNNEKGCIVYGVAVVRVPKDLDCEIRIGSYNAQKVWVNGELVIANDVYHTGMQIDQYNAPIRLRAGENRIVIKLCQNEQKEAWAQQYVFQARLCDATGKAITLAP